MVRYGILNLVQLCIGCRTCMLTCKDVHGIPANNYSGQSAIANGREYYRIWPVDLEQGKYPYVVRNENIYRCMQCKNPACVPACPVPGALTQRKDGIVVVDTTKCNGCQKCIPACPYGALYYRADTKVVDKCDLCATLAGYIDSDNPPACVQACLTNALVFGDLDDPSSTISLEMSKYSTYTQPSPGMNPSVYYIYHQAVMHATIVDASGTPISGATAVATDLVSGLTYSQISDSQGRFAIRKLNVGSSYSLAVTLAGYVPYSNMKIQLTSEYLDLGAVQLAAQTTSTTTTKT